MGNNSSKKLYSTIRRPYLGKLFCMKLSQLNEMKYNLNQVNASCQPLHSKNIYTSKYFICVQKKQ